MQTQYFKRDEGTLAYTDYGGDGEVVIMLPGMGALRSEYRYLGPQLREAGYRAVSVDLRGQGESSVPWKAYDVPSVGNDILALVQHLDAGPAHVIATSFAPAAAVWAAVEQPEAVRSLVLIGASVREATLNPFMKVAVWFMMNNPWRVRTWGSFYRRLYPTRKPEDFEEYLSTLLKNLAEPGRFDACKALGSSPRRPSEERLDRLQAPTLVVMGTRDPDFPDPGAEATYSAGKTRGTVAMIEGAGHYPQTEMPETTGPVIREFLQKVSSSQNVASSTK
jgi:pimeloyl-ACP methyl ester carboxylesterase